MDGGGEGDARTQGTAERPARPRPAVRQPARRAGGGLVRPAGQSHQRARGRSPRGDPGGAAPVLERDRLDRPAPVPTPADLRRLALPPDADLAPNRPGETLLGELEHAPAGTRARHRLRQDLTAQQRIGDAFDALEPEGWRILHCVPLPGLGRIDHLLVGPPGIFCVRTVPGRRQRAVVGDLLLTVGRAEPRPDPRWIRRAAARATLALTAKVTPALAVVDASRVETAPTVRDIRILQPPTATPNLTSSPTTLKPPDVEALFAEARDARTWLETP
ncbi:NERD domain-containing protein [Streptomyces sp. MS1.HAVA.3]|uniref:NERD domain-containing protein n=1 Tax=Streptomyces caledonius TaxID=3134107 RepID=A0ABU8U3M5_9ACTN